MYVAMISTPGYMPWGDGPLPAFDTAGQAWEYLTGEYADLIGTVDYDDECDCDCDDMEMCEAHTHEAHCRAVLADEMQRAHLTAPGTVYAPDPRAYDELSPLGLALSVDTVDGREYALELLTTIEGYARDDVVAAIDSWIDASAPDEQLDMAALDALRDQLDA